MWGRREGEVSDTDATVILSAFCVLLSFRYASKSISQSVSFTELLLGHLEA